MMIFIYVNNPDIPNTYHMFHLCQQSHLINGDYVLWSFRQSSIYMKYFIAYNIQYILNKLIDFRIVRIDMILYSIINHIFCSIIDMGRLSLSPAHLDLRKCRMKNHMNCSYVHILKYDALSVILCHH